MSESWVGGIIAQEVLEAWGGQLQPIATELIPPGLPPGTRRFLVEVGLPTPHVMVVRFAHDDRLGTTVWSEGREYFVITEDESSIPLAIDIQSGQVFAFHPDSPAYTRFFNSDIAAFVLFLGLLQRDALSLRDVPSDVLVEALNSIRISLAHRDPPAMEGTTSWTELLDDLDSQIE